MAATWAVGALSLAGISFWLDFRSWKKFGTGGTPPTLSGYLKIRRWGLYLFFMRQNLLDASPISNTGPAYLNRENFPHRKGPRPKLTRWTLPQRQHPSPITPTAHATLHNLMQDFATTSRYSPYIATRPSKTEGGTGAAIYVNPDIETINPVAHKIFYEIAHVHPMDNSLHVYLSPRDAITVVEMGWGVRFPVGWLAPEGWIMVYAPRDEGEVEAVREIVRAGVCFAVGREV